MAKQGGWRPGSGRKFGVPNKATIERALIAEREVKNAAASGRKLAKEVLQDFLPILAGMTAYHQPTFPGMAAQNPNGNPAEFQRWLELTILCAKTLAPYESPTFKATAVMTIPTAPPPVAPAMIEGKVVRIDDPHALAAVYRRVVTQGRKR